MKTHKKILVCIENPERDAQMFPYVAAVANAAESEEVQLLHVKTTVSAASVAMGSTEPDVSLEDLENLASNSFQCRGDDKVTCHVVSGVPLIEILRHTHEHAIDIVVIGRLTDQPTADSHALLARRVTRKATCSVLTLPVGAKPNVDKILCPVRDSECSAGALDAACGVAAVTGAKVIALNVFQVNPGYSASGSTLEEAQAALKAAAQRENEHLLTRLDTGDVKIKHEYLPDLYDTPEQIILEYAVKNGIDLVVIGARGRTGAAGVLLGTVTEKLIRESPVPVFAIKKKGECLSIVQALLMLAGQE